MFLRVLLLTAGILAGAVTTCQAAVDATVQNGTHGHDVVEAVINVIKAACIFNDDRQFLRRLAYVESLDGVSTATYRSGFDGGIWQVRQDMFDATRSCAPVIRHECDIIRQTFHIDWTQVTWSDLRKPLYSGLAASLYLLQRFGGGNTSFVPSDINGQANLWSHYYHQGNPPASNYTTLAARAAEYTCDDAMDLVFILDGSGSIIPSDFTLSLNFVGEVVRAMPDVPNKVKVAAINFDSNAQIEFYFNTHATKDATIAAIQRIVKGGGGTQTDAALDLARTAVFTTAYGARPQSMTKRVAVLITDGQSNNKNLTEVAARRLREVSGVTMFAIGVGSGIDILELQSVATDPDCTHVYTLSDFSVIQSIITDIERAACKAHTTLTIEEPLIRNDTGPVTITTPTHTNETTVNTVVVNVTCGIVDVYMSYTNPNPNPAMYAEKFTATDGHPAYLTSETTESGQHIYMTVVGTHLPETAEGLKTCTDFHYQVAVIPKTTEVMCCIDGHCHECTPEELKQDHRIREIICSSPEEFPNPCVKDALDRGQWIFPYPYDPSKFIRCDYRGDAYVTICPRQETFNAATMTCGYETPGSSKQTPLPTNYPNPCTTAHITAQYFYFEYAPDRRMYIHCDLWGDAFLVQCPEQEVWSQHDQVCVEDRPQHVTPAATTPAPLVNPCTPEQIAAGHFYFPYPCDHTRFIHCDITGIYWVQFCPGGLYYDPATFICMVNDPQAGSTHGCD